MQNTVEEHLTVQLAAERLNVSTATIDRWIKSGLATSGREGLYPIIQVSRKMRLIPASSINRWLASRKLTLSTKHHALPDVLRREGGQASDGSGGET